VPRLVCTYRFFIEILLAHNFKPDDRKGTSHVRYRGEYGGQVRYVDVAAHNMGDNIPTGTLVSMIRQSGMPKSFFRK
jgi:predicted RNA binding protein YcfA (HicA-like mRNA interferase family)